ncbi:rhodanese-like domain-containing protein [bacterium]|nr:rhodanese-like domain-containing protein [bacterium]MBU1073377.1 rhodanese-like domain-containing protein [bacterium]MBU1674619.1 rhodanese-like domain-containing protein [bacterium]
MKTISTEDLKKMLDAGDVAFFDVRGDVEFEIGHIPGAKTAPLGSLVFRVASVMNPDSFVAVYSAGEGCDLATQAVQRLENLGLRNVHCYRDGLAGWRAAGLPVIPSKNAKLHTQGEFLEVRPIVVDRDKAYGGAFRGKPVDTEGAGG